MNYRNYLITVLLAFVLSASSWTGLVLAQLGAPTASSQWIADMVRAKEEIARSKESPKLVLLSGSSARYNLSAERLERVTGVPTLNLATTGGLGLSYLLDQAKPLLSRGDIVLLAPEYELYNASPAPTSVLLDYVLAQDPGYLKTLRPARQLAFIFAVPWARVQEGLAAKLSGETPDVREYAHLGVLNAHGDETHNRADSRDDALFAKIAAATPERTLTEGLSETTLAWRYLAEFKRWCDAQGVRLLASYPATLEFPAYHTPKSQTVLSEITQHYRRLNVPVLGQPETFMYPAPLMYDTQYHLTDVGMKQNTQTLLNLLSPHLATQGTTSATRNTAFQKTSNEQ